MTPYSPRTYCADRIILFTVFSTAVRHSYHARKIPSSQFPNANDRTQKNFSPRAPLHAHRQGFEYPPESPLQFLAQSSQKFDALIRRIFLKKQERRLESHQTFYSSMSS